MGGQLLKVTMTDKTKSSRNNTVSSEHKLPSKNRSEKSEHSSQMVYTDEEIQVMEEEGETKYHLPKLAKNLVKNKKKINYNTIQQLQSQRGKPTPN